MPATPDHRLAQLARAQYGLFTRSQAPANEISNRMLQICVARHARTPLTRRLPNRGHARQLASATPRRGVARRARLLRLASRGRRAARLRRVSSEVVEVIHHQRRDYRDSSGVIVHTTSVLDSCDRTSLGPIPVTTPVRTLIDLGAVVRPDRLEEALDSAERDGHVDRFELATRHAQIRQSGRNGVGPLALLLDDSWLRASAPRSVLERRMLRLLSAAGLPEPECQVRVPRADGRVAFLDLAYPEVQLGIELDGHAWHATALQRQRDHERQNQVVVVSDWTILRFTYADVSSRPEHVAALVRHALFAGASSRSIPA